jgi:hypothetical protein
MLFGSSVERPVPYAPEDVNLLPVDTSLLLYGIPSTTYNGSLLPKKEELPLIITFVALPAVADDAFT